MGKEGLLILFILFPPHTLKFTVKKDEWDSLEEREDTSKLLQHNEVKSCTVYRVIRVSQDAISISNHASISMGDFTKAAAQSFIEGKVFNEH